MTDGEKNSERNVPVERETNIECPVCSSKLFLVYYTTEISFEREIYIQSYVCHNCLYKESEIFQLNTGEPIRVTMYVKSPEDLGILLYRSPSTTVLIPEIAAEIYPGENSEGGIISIEGLLDSLRERFNTMIQDFEGDQEELKKILSFFDAIEKKEDESFTLILEDRSGKCRINSSKALIDRLDTLES